MPLLGKSIVLLQPAELVSVHIGRVLIAYGDSIRMWRYRARGTGRTPPLRWCRVSSECAFGFSMSSNPVKPDLTG